MSEIMSRRADAVAGTRSGLRQYCSRVTRPALTPPRELIRLILSVAAEQKAKGFKDTKISGHKTVDADHGQSLYGRRRCEVAAWRHQRSGLKSGFSSIRYKSQAGNKRGLNACQPVPYPGMHWSLIFQPSRLQRDHCATRHS
jgi:hypothetical protein